MTPTPELQERIRRYLLGQLVDGAREEIEKDLLATDELFEELLVVEDEIIDEYLGGKLDDGERTAFEQYFLITPERHDKLKFGRAFNRYLSSRSVPMVTPHNIPGDAAGVAPDRLAESATGPWAWTQNLLSSPLRIGICAIIVVGIAFGIWRVFVHQSEVDKGLLALNAAYREQRPLEARISQLDYAPYLTTRGPGSEKIDQNELRLAELTLLDGLNKSPTPPVHHALGRVYLAKKEFDKAIEQFDEALKGDPKNAQLYGDLGAAWLEKGKTERAGPEPGKGLEDFARSLGKLDQALGLKPNLLEPLFNRAIVHQYLMLPNQAKDDWLEYLKNDPTSPWANEARRNLKSLQDEENKPSQTKEQIRQDFQSAYEAHDSERAWEVIRHSRDAFSIGKQIRDQLLDEYLQASTNDENNDANSRLQALAFMGQLELKKTGDVYTSELSRFYSRSSPGQRAILSQARELMKLGQGYYARAKPLDAIVVFNKSEELFTGIGDSWEAQYAELWIGYCYINASDTQRSVTILEPLASYFDRHNHKWLFMRALHLLSGAEYDLSEYSKALNHNHRSLALAEQMGDAIGAFNTLSILIEQYRYIGNYEQALACVQGSLFIIDSCALNQVQIAQHYGIIASVLSSSGFHSAAADYQKEAVRRALTTSQVQTISRAYANLGSIYGKMGNYSQALENFNLAYEAAKSHSDESIRKGMMAYSSLQIGDLYRQTGDITKAIDRYDECLDLNKSLDNYYGQYEAHKNRLSCYITKRDDLAAKEELKTTLGLVEKYRSQILEGDNRNHFFDTEQSVYDLAIDFEYSRMNNVERAFEYSEASRARSLLDLVNSQAQISDKTGESDLVFRSLAQPLTLREVQGRIPNRAQIVQYAVLDDKLLIWLVSKTTFSIFESKTGEEQLALKIRKYLQAVSGKSYTHAEATQDAKELFEILIRPVERSLDRSDPVYLVPDKALNYLPFGALVSPETNRFLVQDYLTVVSPSSSLLVICSDVARKKEGRTVERLLSVGNPSFDNSEFPGLSALPAAEREAEEVAKLYDAKCLLTNKTAIKRRVKMEMETADVIHLAVHTVLDQHSPLRSKLVLAKQPGASGSHGASDALEAREIYGTKLPQTRIVVLSACQSGVEQYYGGEGMISLARPFLAASVPLIVVSLWPVDSDSTAELMISFHKHRVRDNVSSAEALRRAQLDMLTSSEEDVRQPYYWAAFTAVGGWTSF